MDDAIEQRAVKIEFKLRDKAHAPLLRKKVDEWFTEGERAKLTFEEEDGRITISGPDVLLQRLVASLSTLKEK